jgi:hypothetical protein
MTSKLPIIAADQGIENPDYSAPHPPLTLHEIDLYDRYAAKDRTRYRS